MKKVVLASKSPRRRALLEMLGLDFEIDPSQEPELAPEHATPAEIVKSLAAHKAAEVFEKHRETLVIGADTIVWLDGELLGKPASEEEAFAMLKRLSGHWHEVYTGISLIDEKGEISDAECSKVLFRELKDEEIIHYIRSGEPMDKAGAYGAQGKGALFVKRIEGDFFNVVGLPVCRLCEMLSEKGVRIL